MRILQILLRTIQHFLNRTIVCDGTSSTRVSSEIDSELSANRPVVAGIRYSNGDTHFIVLMSGSNVINNE